MYRMELNYSELQYFIKSIESFLHEQTFSNCKYFLYTLYSGQERISLAGY